MTPYVNVKIFLSSLMTSLNKLSLLEIKRLAKEKFAADKHSSLFYHAIGNGKKSFMTVANLHSSTSFDGSSFTG
jgi:hypothetical protein